MKTTNTESAYESDQLISLSMNSHLKVEDGLVFDSTKTAVLKSLYDRAYYIVPEGVKVIKSLTFAFNNRLTFVDLPDSLEELGDEVFSKACKMEDLIMPDSVKRVGSQLCSGCEDLKHAYVSESIKRLGFQMFYGCLNLKGIVLGSFTTNHLIEAEPGDLEGVDADSCVLFVAEQLMDGYRKHPVWRQFKNIRNIEDLL
ncbi:MAG: leucine-rich repeat domain-containing protein [Paludibacteraceae bacterium]|nr:leucine-rich repeat domain-containing protein [Paludibacteraceae bacterium]